MPKLLGWMGASSTHPSATSGTTGVDTLRVLFEVDRVPERRLTVDLQESWVVDPLPAFGMVAIEGNPAHGALWSPDEVMERGREVRAFVDGSLGLRGERGVSRLDVTTSRRLAPSDGRAFLSGMAAVELPRLEGTRRPSVGQARSVWWTGARSAAIKARAYCESFKVEGREVGERVRLEDQRRFGSGARPELEAAADPEQQRRLFMRRFEPMRKAVDGVKAASFPVIAQALADEVKYGYRSHREVERLAGALVILSGGGGEGYPRRTLYRRRAELREAGYVVAEGLSDKAVEVDLGDELEAALAEFGR